MAKTKLDQVASKTWNVNIRGVGVGALARGISAGFWTGSAISALDGTRQEFGAHFKKMAASGGRVRTREWEWPWAGWSEAC